MEEFVFVDSRIRDPAIFPYGNTYSVYLSNPLKNISNVSLISARVPNSIYNYSNAIGASFLSVGASAVSLPSGFYSATTLVNELSVNTTLSGAGVSVAYSAADGKFIFSSASSFTITATTAQSGLLLGMPPGVQQTAALASGNPPYAANSLYSSKYILKSSNVCDFTSNELLFLDIEELRNQKLNLGAKLVNVRNNTANTNVLVTSMTMASKAFGPITLDALPGSIKTFSENADFQLKIQFPQPISKLERITVNWRDITGNIVNFNGSDNNSFILKVERTDEPKVLDRDESLPPPVPFDDSEFNIKIYVVLAVMAAGLLLILLMRPKK